MIPLLDCTILSPSFDGDLYFLLGQGLGDTVKGLRFVFLLRKTYPNANLFLYGDKRWEEIIREIQDVAIRWYPKGVDIRNPKEGQTSPYDFVKTEILKSLDYRPSKSYLALENSSLISQWANGESDAQVMAKTINLSVDKENLRAYIPPTAIDRESAESFLRDNDLLDKRYIVISPHTWPVKDWGKEKFVELATKIQNSSGLRVVVLGIRELGTLPLPDVVHGLSLPLKTVIALISKAEMVIGNDSGLSHIASAFNLPVVVIYRNREDLPFCIKIQSPFSALILANDFFGAKNGISLDVAEIETVHSVAISLLKDPASCKGQLCPACKNEMEFIETSGIHGFHWALCHCGSRVLTKTGEPMISPSESCLNEYIVPYTLNNHLDSEITSEYVMHVTDVSSSHQVNIDLFKKALEGSLETDYFILSFDGAMKYLSRNGYFVRNVKQLESPGKIIFTLNISKKFFQKQLFIPWGKGVLKTNQNYYCRYFSWRIWAIPLRWRGMPKMALKEENPILARKLAFILFWMDPNIKVLRYFFKSIFYRSRKFLGSV